jgi:CBS domain-containing protein
MLVSHILADKGDLVMTILDTAPLAAAAKALADEHIGALVVTDASGRLAGVVSEREVVRALARHGAAALNRRVREVMAAATTVQPQDSVRHVMTIMTERRARHLPVVNGTRVVGLLSIGDVIKSRLSEKEAENRVLQDIARWPHAA